MRVASSQVHELSIAQSLVETAVAEARRNGATRVVRVELALGSMSGVQPDALAFCFPLVAKGTLCEDAKLEITAVPAEARCPACSGTPEVEHPMAPCPACGHWPLEVLGGRELTLGDLGTREGLLGGINAVIVGNYLTTLGRPATADLDLLAELKMPVKELQKTL